MEAWFQELRRKRWEWVQSTRDNDFEEGVRRSAVDKYPDPVHFVYELLQNAEDQEATRAEFELKERCLIFRHNGKPFCRADVEKITGLGNSSKRAEGNKIGRFGIGFKSVFAITPRPEVHSWLDDKPVSFAIEDLVVPVPLDCPSGLRPAETAFVLPLHAQDADRLHARILAKLQILGADTLLFLRHLELIVWSTPNQGGEYLCLPQGHADGTCRLVSERKRADGVQVSEDHAYQRFSSPVDLGGADCELTVSLAFRLDEANTIGAELGQPVLNVYFPTEETTGLRFRLHAPMLLTDNRANTLQGVEENQLLAEASGELLASAILLLKDQAYLTPSFFEVVPLPGDFNKPLFAVIGKAAWNCLRTQPVIPTHTGAYAAITQVMCCPDPDLRLLLTDSDLVDLTKCPGATWAHSDLHDGETRRGRAIRYLGAAEIGREELIGWIGAKSRRWWVTRSNEWLHGLYAYLSRDTTADDRLKSLPLARTGDGAQAAPGADPVFFSPGSDGKAGTDSLHADLPFVLSSLLEDDEPGVSDRIRSFLERLGVAEAETTAVIKRWIIPKYYQDPPPDEAANRLHIRYLYHALTCDPYLVSYRIQGLERTPLLWCRRASVAGKAAGGSYVSPNEAYLPQTYTGSDLLATFLAHSGAWFVDPERICPGQGPEDIREFLKKLGCSDQPRLVEIRVASADRAREQCLRWGVDAEAGLEFIVEDLDGLEAALKAATAKPDRSLSRAIWHWVATVRPGTLRYRRPQTPWDTYDKPLLPFLKDERWLLDDSGSPRRPTELYKNSDQLRAVFGQSAAYIDPRYDLSSESTRCLARELGVTVEVTPEVALERLRILSRSAEDANLDQVIRLYEILSAAFGRASQIESERIQQAFQSEQLLFSPEPAPRWKTALGSFWEDASHLFRKRAVYLSPHYPGHLRDFFVQRLGVLPTPGPRQYVALALTLAKDRAVDPESRAILLDLYTRIYHAISSDPSIREDQNWLELLDGPYWLGQTGDCWGFYGRSDLVWNDQSHVANAFGGRLPFFAGHEIPSRDLAHFADHLLIDCCSRCRPDFQVGGDLTTDEYWTAKMRRCAASLINFLSSPRWRSQLMPPVSLEETQSIRLVLCSELTATYTLKCVTVEAVAPGDSFYCSSDAVVYLLSTASEKPRLIAEALARHFRRPELDRVVEDLLTLSEAVAVAGIERRYGVSLYHPDSPPASQGDTIPVPVAQSDSPSADKEAASTLQTQTIAPPSSETQLTDSETTAGAEARTDTPPASTKPNPASPLGPVPTTLGDSAHREARPRESAATIHQTYRPDRHAPREDGSLTGHIDFGSGAESPQHLALKERLAGDPSLLRPGLTLVEKEAVLGAGLRVDLLYKDEDGRPVPVEVEVPFDDLDTRLKIGMWQALEYRFVAAAHYGIPVDRVRAILAAPSIPAGIQHRCRNLGIDPVDVPSLDP